MALHCVESGYPGGLGHLEDAVPAPRSSGPFPINEFSAEILIEIFSLVCADKYSRTTSRVSNALAISHVCQLWRSVSLSCSSLWSTICLGSCLRGGPSLARLVDLYCARSRQSPLDIECNATYRESNLKDAFAALANHSERWRSVDVRPQLIEYFGRVHMPRLESATILDNNSSDRIQNEPLRIFADTPRLARWKCDFGLSKISLPWAQLTELEFMASRAHAGWLAAVVPRMRLLRRLVVHIVVPHPQGTPHVAARSRIVFPSTLRDLSLIGQGDPEFLISSSTFTRLEDLAIRRCRAWSHDAFMRMAERSMLHDTLRAFTLKNVRIGFADLLQVLRLLARLTTLRVCDPSLDEDPSYAPRQLNAGGLLAALTMSSAAVTSELLLPHLEKLSLEGRLAIADEALIDMVSSRPGLRELALQFVGDGHLKCDVPLTKATLDSLASLVGPDRAEERSVGRVSFVRLA
ncbi:hypothetical protein GGF50DRAFT_111785 [Schizophyllum commune]